MKKPLSILLLEDEPIECTAIINYIDTVDDVRLVGVTNNTEKALEYLVDCCPDAIILDLELHKGKGNGLMFLKTISEMTHQVLPYVLITTNNTSPVTYEKARQLGADFIMAKTQVDYSAENVVDFLRSMKSTLHNSSRQNARSLDELTSETNEQIKKRIHKRIITEMEFIGISPKATGRKYIIDAIMMLVENSTSNIHAAIAATYGKSDASVERAMQNAINGAWRTSDIEDLCLHYKARISSERGVPTITEFIYYYAEKVKDI